MSSRASRIWLLAGVALIAILTGMVTTILGTRAIYPGVSVGGVYLGGLSVQQARHRIKLHASKPMSSHVTLRCGDDRLSTDMEDLGGSIDVESSALSAHRIGRDGNVLRRLGAIISARRNGTDLPLIYSFNQERLSEYLHVIAEKIDREPKDARPVVEGGVLRIAPEKPGIKLDIEKSREEITRAINSGAGEAELVAAFAAPKTTSEDLKEIDGIIASYSTPYKPWQRDRSHNLRTACAAINGILLEPGELFSYNKVVGPRTREHGYRNAPMFMRGQVEPGTGGGVCQVSTTVYNAALLANLQIVKRSHHSQPVVYAPVGRDATVAYPALDLRFRNTSDFPIYIIAAVGKRTVDISILGKKDNNIQVEIISVGHRITKAPVVEKEEDGIEPGHRIIRREGRAGHRISTYRLVKVNGEVVKRDLISTDYYSPESRVTAVARPVSYDEHTSGSGSRPPFADGSRL